MLTKQICNFFCMNNEFFTYVVVIIGIYCAQTMFKISKVRKTGEFDWKKLVDGIIDYSLYFIGLMVFFFVGTMIPDKQIINFDGKSYTITSLLTLFAYILMVAQAKKCFDNIMATFDITPETVRDIQAEILKGKEVV